MFPETVIFLFPVQGQDVLDAVRNLSSFGHNKLNLRDSFFIKKYFWARLIHAKIILIAWLSFDLSAAAALSLAQPC